MLSAAVMQDEGPSHEDITTVLTLEQRSFEEQQEENSYWQTSIVNCYRGALYLQVRPSSPA